MILRRYLPADAGIKTLADLRFRIGRIHEANDPSEFLANYTLHGAALPPSWSEFLTGIVKDSHGPKVGRICFSAESVTNQLMWGHYADGGRGLCIEVESDALGLDSDVIFPVNYSTPPSIEAASFHDPSPERQAILKRAMTDVLKTKSSSWSYELEQRVFVQLRGELSTMDSVTKEVTFYFSINPAAIRSVYIGAAASTKTAVSASDCLRHHRLSVDLKKMVLNPSTGNMVAEAYD
jgi:hypothetical protein